MRSDIAPGRTLPDYELPDHTGTRRRLSELQGDGPDGSRAQPWGLLPEGSQAG